MKLVFHKAPKPTFLLWFFFLLFRLAAAQSYQPAPENLAARQAFQDDKFGMFIHWGVYSVLGDAEWVMQNQTIPVPVYEKLPRLFNPTAFNAKTWVGLAKSAGMKYITITSKHHDGFAMWGSKVSKYNIVDATPYGKDVLKALADECAKEGIKLFFYHSQLDWHHPDYFPRGKTGRLLGRPEAGNFEHYLQYMDAQLAELLGGDYGKVAGIWFDGWWDQATTEADHASRQTNVNWQLRRTYDRIHKLQPAALVGNNHHVAPFEGEDFQMFERDLPGENQFGYNTKEISPLPLETCETLNGAWGFQLSDQRYKSPEQLVHYLVNAAGRNANFLLNIGPMPNGEIQPEFVERLAAVGNWVTTFGPTVYGTRGGIVPPQAWGVSTKRGDTQHFLHILKKPATAFLFVPNFTPAVASVRFFQNQQPLRFKQQPEGLFVYLDGLPAEAWDYVLDVKTK